MPNITEDNPDLDAWRRLEDAAADRGHRMRLCAVATAREDGGPDVRLLVLRGADAATRCLWFHTDRRSPKVRQLLACSDASLVTWDARDGVQLRAQGQIRVRTDDVVADHHWEQTEMSVRLAYGQPSPPGAADPVRDPRLETRAQSQRRGGEDDSGRANFAVLEMWVVAIDRLDLGASNAPPAWT